MIRNNLQGSKAQQQQIQVEIQQLVLSNGLLAWQINKLQDEKVMIQIFSSELDRQIAQLRQGAFVQQDIDDKQMDEQQRAMMKHYRMQVQWNRRSLRQRQQMLDEGRAIKSKREGVEALHCQLKAELSVNASKYHGIYQLAFLIVQKQKVTRSLHHIIKQYDQR